MKPTTLSLTVLALGAVLMAGCSQAEFSESIWNPFHLEFAFDITQPPVRMAIAHPEEGMLALESWFLVREAPPHAGLRNALGRHLGCRVQIQELKPFQIAAHLQSGRIQYALVSQANYEAMLEDGPVGEIIATATPLIRKGLIVASAKSGIEEISQIKGKRFAFGPKDDAILDIAAAHALEVAGISKADIHKELIPLLPKEDLIPLRPNLERLQYHLSSFESAKEIVYGLGTEVGVIEAAEYESYPETGGRLLPLRFAQDDFRILGETEETRSETTLAGPFVASPVADPETTRKILEFLSAADARNRRALHDVGLARFDVKGGAAGSFSTGTRTASSSD
ncbi:MAG: phosphate/phosphite/phosphonate ABC transporter substrate-binding protein [bacterium]|nr:phosphate/phosphite/phosphonate ABC transporter substrate-binding protein [bacterium]